MTKLNPNNENEAKSDIFHRKNSNLTSFFIGRKILKYFNVFYNCHLLISSQKWAKTSKIKLNQTEHVQNFSLFTSITVFQCLLEFISWYGFSQKWNNNSSVGIMAIIWFDSINVKGNWAFSREKLTSMSKDRNCNIRYHENILFVLS